MDLNGPEWTKTSLKLVIYRSGMRESSKRSESSLLYWKSCSDVTYKYTTLIMVNRPVRSSVYFGLTLPWNYSDDLFSGLKCFDWDFEPWHNKLLLTLYLKFKISHWSKSRRDLSAILNTKKLLFPFSRDVV